MKIVEVSNKSHIKKFHQLPYFIYKNDPNWIPHIKQEIEAVFNPNKKCKHIVCVDGKSVEEISKEIKHILL